jgi:hypothetical protein
MLVNRLAIIPHSGVSSIPDMKKLTTSSTEALAHTFSPLKSIMSEEIIIVSFPVSAISLKMRSLATVDVAELLVIAILIVTFDELVLQKINCVAVAPPPDGTWYTTSSVESIGVFASLAIAIVIVYLCLNDVVKNDIWLEVVVGSTATFGTR